MEEKLGEGYDQSLIQDLFEDYVSKLSDNAIKNILIVSGNIPDMYSETSSEERLFTKLMEILTKEAFVRLGLKANCVKQKSSYQDVTVTVNGKKIVVDSKSFRLSRSQGSPNPKDFIKVSDYELWLSRFEKEERLGGLVVYPCTHEWSSYSEVYRNATNPKLPIVILSYRYLAFLLEYKNRYKPEEFAILWNYRNIFPKQDNTRDNYWNNMNRQIRYLTHTSEEEFDSFMKHAQHRINHAIYKHQLLFKKFTEYAKKELSKKIESMTKEQLIEAYKKDNFTTFTKMAERIARRKY